MRVSLLTREYPPEVYGGAGVHVEYLARELLELVDLTVHAFGAERPGVKTYRPWEALKGNPALETMSVDLAMTAGVDGAQLVHTHTWYANLAGHLSKLNYGVPHVATTHSLEPMRPWKEEQLGGGYNLSSFCERTALEGADAIIAVSGAMRDDVLQAYPAVDSERVTVIHNGIDTEEYKPDPNADVLERHGVDPSRPYVIFVGRITHQKGVEKLLDAALHFDKSTQLVLCAGAPDTKEIGERVHARVSELQASRDGVLWIEEMLPRPEVIQLLTHATVFVCPSIYEPLGIVNLEAMACGTAVVASRIGGIPEVVVDAETGYLVDLDDAFAENFAERVNELLANPALAQRFGVAGRECAVRQFSWRTIAERTAALYESLV
ncbi:MAG: glycogen synthase [Gaiellaceae bacterium]